MTNATFDARKSEPPASVRRRLMIIVLATVASVLVASSVSAQIPGLPVLQNAWSTEGMTGALNVGGGGGSAVYAGAVSLSSGIGHFSLTGGGGYRTRTGGAGGGGVAGLRAALPFGGSDGSLGLALTAGVGGGAGGTFSTTARCNFTTVGCRIPVGATGPNPGFVVVDSMGSTVEIPVGLGFGWRHMMSATRGFSVYTTPAYVFYSGGTRSGSGFRAAVATDFGLSTSMGITAGLDFGSNRPRGLGGPTGVTFGIGASYAFTHQ
jgi:hypothetical protein